MPHVNLMPRSATPPPRLRRASDVPEGEVVCPGCLGKGRYVGFTTVEDPCLRCKGTGLVTSRSPS